MKILINNKICDNSPACGGVDVCPTGALFWDDAASQIVFEESKCIGCGACVNACPVRAIMLARDAAAAAKIQADIDADPREAADLFVDRYGADIADTQPTPADEAVAVARDAPGLAVIELYEEANLRCLVTSIPMSEIFAGYEYKHIKTEADEEIMSALGVGELPAMVIFRDGKQIGKVEGYFEDNGAEKALLISKMKKILE